MPDPGQNGSAPSLPEVGRGEEGWLRTAQEDYKTVIRSGVYKNCIAMLYLVLD